MLLPLFDLTQQFETTSGTLNVGGYLKVFYNDTDDLARVYDDVEGETIKAQPIVLDSNGRAGNVYVTAGALYRLEVYSRTGALLWTVENMRSEGDGSTVIVSRDGTITVKSVDGVVDLGVNDTEVSVLTGTGAERGTDGNFAISKTASSGEGLEVTGNRVKVKKAGWYHIEATWYAQSNTTANGYRTVELSTRDSRTKLTLDLTVSSEQWRIIANDFYLHADEYIDFTLTGMGSDSAVRSWLQNVSIHRLTNIVGNPPDRVRPDWAEQDPNSPAYIFNKPNLAPVATTGSYESLTDKPDLDIYATKVEDATEGNLAALDAEGNLVDSGEASENLVHDANYVHTDNNYTTADKDKLAVIEAGAEVNVQADWTEEDSSKDSYIQNKPHVPTVSGDGTSISSIDGLPIYAASATMATQDGVGNNIVDTYGTKAEVSAKQDQLTDGINISISNAGKIDVKNIASSAYNLGSIALGENTLASGIDTFTHGRGTSAVSYGAHAEGQNTLADGNYAHAEGYGPTAHGNYSHAEGYSTISNNEYSHAEGYQTSALVGRSHVEGFQTLTSGGIYTHAEGFQTSAIGTRSHAEGENTVAGGQGSHAEGYATSATGTRSHAEGDHTQALGAMAHAEGYQTKASGEGSHTEGYTTSAIGQRSHSEGNATTALGNFSHAEGYQTTASGNYSHVEGNGCVAGTQAHAEGLSSYAIGAQSHAEGYECSAVGAISHVEGRGTISDTNHQHVEGRYNAPAVGALHVIGNGTGTYNRSNIVETYTDRVNINGILVNDSNDRTITKFMFDSTPLSLATQTKLLIKYGPISPPSLSAAKTYGMGNYTFYNNSAGVTDSMYLINASGVEVIDWEGNVGRIMHGNISTYRPPVAYPDYLPASRYQGSTNLLAFGAFAAENTAITAIPSGWLPSLQNYIANSGLALYNVGSMFRGCTRLTGDVKPWMDFVLAQSGTGQAGNPDRPTYRAGMFAGCTLVDDYAALSTSETYSAFFA